MFSIELHCQGELSQLINVLNPSGPNRCRDLSQVNASQNL